MTGVTQVTGVALVDIAAGLEVTTAQRERGVAIVDGTDATLAERLAPYAEALPCTPVEAATVLEAYVGGASVGEAAGVAGLAPIEGAKTLHLLGEPVTPLGPTGRDVVRNWLAAELSRVEAVELAGATEAEFALATYVETHDPLEGAAAAAGGALETGGDTAVAKRDHLGETMSDVTDLG